MHTQCLKCNFINQPGAELCAGCNSILLDQAKYLAKASDMAQPQDQRKQIETAQKGFHISLAAVGLAVLFGVYMVFLRPAAQPPESASSADANTNTAQIQQIDHNAAFGQKNGVDLYHDSIDKATNRGQRADWKSSQPMKCGSEKNATGSYEWVCRPA